MDPFIAYDYNHYNALANDYYKVKKHYQWSNETTKLPLIYLPWLNKASKSMCSFLPQFLLRISSEYPHIQTGSSFPYTLFWGNVCYLFLNADAARDWVDFFVPIAKKKFGKQPNDTRFPKPDPSHTAIVESEDTGNLAVVFRMKTEYVRFRNSLLWDQMLNGSRRHKGQQKQRFSIQDGPWIPHGPRSHQNPSYQYLSYSL